MKKNKETTLMNHQLGEGYSSNLNWKDMGMGEWLVSVGAFDCFISPSMSTYSNMLEWEVVVEAPEIDDDQMRNSAEMVDLRAVVAHGVARSLGEADLYIQAFLKCQYVALSKIQSIGHGLGALLSQDNTNEGKGPNRNGIMDHVVKCGSCEYTTNMIGDLTAHRKAHHTRSKRN